jgi:hypothetical protein
MDPGLEWGIGRGREERDSLGWMDEGWVEEDYVPCKVERHDCFLYLAKEWFRRVAVSQVGRWLTSGCNVSGREGGNELRVEEGVHSDAA